MGELNGFESNLWTEEPQLLTATNIKRKLEPWRRIINKFSKIVFILKSMVKDAPYGVPTLKKKIKTGRQITRLVQHLDKKIKIDNTNTSLGSSI